MSEGIGTPLPQWQSHKKVWADKIVGIHRAGTMQDVFFTEWRLDGGGSVPAPPTLVGRVPEGQSAIGGYYVRYEDGFESWSPAKAFEEGYTRI